MANNDMKTPSDNVQMALEGDILTIRINVGKTFGMSASGKSVIVASTGGNVSVPGQPDVKIGLNAYRPRK